MKFLSKVATVRRQYHGRNEMQISMIVYIKTGHCPDDCSYCPQIARYHTNVKMEALMVVEEVIAKGLQAKAVGSSRVCMGASWRNIKEPEFNQVLEMVRSLNKLDIVVCCTLGMSTENQAHRLLGNLCINQQSKNRQSLIKTSPSLGLRNFGYQLLHGNSHFG